MIAGLRDYQKQMIIDTYKWLRSNPGNPCIMAPTGSGKSWVIAGLCEDILSKWKTSRIIVLSHVKELLAQNAEKIKLAWPEAPLGIYSAGLGRKDIDTITVAGIQSIHRKAKEIGPISLAIIDECHLINNRAQGMYRKFLAQLATANPLMRVIGLTATPYRLGQGSVVKGKKIGDDGRLIDKTPDEMRRDQIMRIAPIFDDLIESITIDELVERGFLAPLESRFTGLELDTSGIRRQNGEFDAGEMEDVIDTPENNQAIVKRIIEVAGSRRAWLIFCASVNHAAHMCDELWTQGIAAEMVTGETPKAQRDAILRDYKAGKIRALTNVNVLTTGFDYPDVDVIAMARPTLSPGLYVQMAGRGMRVKSGDYHDCYILDFVGNIQRHNGIKIVKVPESGPTKKCPKCKTQGIPANAEECPKCGFHFKLRECPECNEMAPTHAPNCPYCGHKFADKQCPNCEMKIDRDEDVCPHCGYKFTRGEGKKRQERKSIIQLNTTRDIMENRIGGSDAQGRFVKVSGWRWYATTSKSGKDMLRVDFYTRGSMFEIISIYVCLLHDGYTQLKARQLLVMLGGDKLRNSRDLQLIAKTMNSRDFVSCPNWIKVTKEGGYYTLKEAGRGDVPTTIGLGERYRARAS